MVSAPDKNKETNLPLAVWHGITRTGILHNELTDLFKFLTSFTLRYFRLGYSSYSRFLHTFTKNILILPFRMIGTTLESLKRFIGISFYQNLRKRSF